jgi:hypothetical protein
MIKKMEKGKPNKAGKKKYKTFEDPELWQHLVFINRQNAIIKPVVSECFREGGEEYLYYPPCYVDNSR